MELAVAMESCIALLLDCGEGTASAVADDFWLDLSMVIDSLATVAEVAEAGDREILLLLSP